MTEYTFLLHKHLKIPEVLMWYSSTLSAAVHYDQFPVFLLIGSCTPYVFYPLYLTFFTLSVCTFCYIDGELNTEFINE